MKLTFACIFAATLFFVGSAVGEEKPTFEGLWADVTRSPDCSQEDHPDFILVTCEKSMTLWYFTQPNHPAHPGVIKRSVEKKGDGVYVHEDGQSFASDDKQPAFKAWMAQIADLDRKAREDLQRRSGQSAPSSN
jgi:hypothetical protein